jgi:AraC-like DNA-binding protein
MAGRPITDPPRGVLRTPGEDAFSLRRWEPGAALAPYVSWFWGVQWDLRGRAPHEQTTLPHPSAHLVYEEDGRAWLYGPPHSAFRRTLRDDGFAVGLRFRPGGIRPLLQGPVSDLADQRLPAGALPGLDGDALARQCADCAGDLDAVVAVIEAALRPLLPAAPDPAVALADRAVALLAEDRALTRVADLADRLALSPRSVQRLFSEHVGVGPASVIRRFRLQEAAAHATEGGEVDWAGLAATLGYYDQAHLVRDFTQTIGVPPARYAAGAATR